MKKFNIKRSAQKGSLMVEAIALLGLITMVTPILYKKAAERTTELQDINVATQMRMVSSAVDQYISDYYNEIGEEHDGEDMWKLSDEEMEKLEEYLPHGFDVQKSKMFEDFEVAVRKREVTDRQDRVHNVFTSAVLAPLRDKLTMVRSSKIASMIGANGGVYRQVTGSDGSVVDRLDGVQGSWQATLDDYGLQPDEGISYKDGSLVVISTDAISGATGDVTSDQALYRVNDGDLDKNTMQTTLYMDGNNIDGIVSLIAAASGGGQNNTVYIGEAAGGSVSNLWVTGTTNLVGAVTMEDGLTVNVGDTEKLDVNSSGINVTGNLQQQGGYVEFAPSRFWAAVSQDINFQTGSGVTINNTSGDVNISTGGGMKLKSGMSNTYEAPFHTFTGSEDFSVTMGENVNIVAKGDDGTLSLKASGSGGDVYIKASGGSIDLEDSGVTIKSDDEFKTSVGEKSVTINNTGTTVEGGLIVDNVTADNLTALDALMVGTDGSEFISSSSGTAIKGNNFSVGSSGSKIKVSDDSTFVGYESGRGFTATSSNLVLRNHEVTYVSLGNNGIELATLDAKFNVSENVVSAETSYMKSEMTSDTWSVGHKDGWSNGGEISLDSSGDFWVESGNLQIGSRGMSFPTAQNSTDADAGINEITSLDDSVINSASNAKVAISRQGIIEVKAPTSSADVGGYIRARRLVSDIPYPGKGVPTSVYNGYDDAGGTMEKPYDYYQVNPAYTSVMNDIKLASRGGARLSDILPDFINKGIYVADNTYEDSSIGSWDNIQITNGAPPNGLGVCTSASCIASPWLGFIPAPQCPKNYAKVVTINPVRWRMAEAFSVYGAQDWQGTSEEAFDEEIIKGSKFFDFFGRPSDPRESFYELTTENGSEAHTHEPTGYYPLTFQTNTWLNTTVQPYYDGAADETGIVGWHAVMGFIYRPQQYNAVLKIIGGDPDSAAADDVFWNVFPVYAQDQAAIVNTYCFFDRKPGNSGWTWGTAGPVYDYDQLYNYRGGYNKTNAWLWQVNDPDLGYDDAW